MNTRDAISNTTKEVCNQSRLDPDGAAMLSFGSAGGGGERQSYNMVVEQPPSKQWKKLARVASKEDGEQGKVVGRGQQVVVGAWL